MSRPLSLLTQGNALILNELTSSRVLSEHHKLRVPVQRFSAASTIRIESSTSYIPGILISERSKATNGSSHRIRGRRSVRCKQSSKHTLIAAAEDEEDSCEVYGDPENASDVPVGTNIEILKLFIPAVAAVMADPLASMVDTIFVGKLGTVQLASLSSNTTFYSFIFMIINYSLAPAITNLVTRACLQEDQGKAEAGRHIRNAMLLAITLGPALSLALGFSAQPILVLLGCEQGSPLLREATAYFLSRVWSVPALMIITIGQGAFRGLCDLNTTFWVSSMMALANIVLDYWFLFVLGWGVAGAGLATAISQLLGAAAFLLLLTFRHPALQLWSKLRIPTVTEVMPLVQSSLALVCRNLAVMSTWVNAARLVTGEGVVPAATHQILSQVFWMLTFLPEGFVPVTQILVGRAHACHRYVISFAIAARIMTCAAVFSTVIMIGLFSCPLAVGPIANFFSTNPGVVAATSSGLILVGFLQPICGFMFVLEGVVVAMSDVVSLAKISIIAALTFQILVTVLWHLLFHEYPPRGICNIDENGIRPS
ncbi:hypothetical protein CYMTET_23512 [Cymbomonas tetramitiformis]|uniref:Protein DETOXIFICATION n=1 Tax=Cymbomonas tetramitiformis TaxID=36881 RepID=A0AAE0FYH8_9CHLO|nr:hypothetical protein CYMTET_23512 [Cymbomonas tetramitiformis]